MRPEHDAPSNAVRAVCATCGEDLRELTAAPGIWATITGVTCHSTARRHIPRKSR